MLTPQKLAQADFSAGISENIVPGKPNSYARADNFLITRDKQLLTRPGSQIMDLNVGWPLAQLPNAQGQRISRLIPFYNDTNLFATSGRSVSVATSTGWSEILGPSGGEAFLLQSATGIVASAEWRQQLILIPDGGDAPQVVYQDSTNAWRLRQLGLPRPTLTASASQGQLLAQAINLATTIRANLMSHVSDIVSHLQPNSSAYAALAALTQPVVVADLVAYTQVLVTQYNVHLTDALATTTSQVFHIQKNSPPSLSIPLGRYAVLNFLASTLLATPVDLPTSIAVLNDLRHRFNMHTYATLTHRDAVTNWVSGGWGANTSGTYPTLLTGYGKYFITTPDVVINSTTTGGVTVYNPIFSGQLGSLLGYINQLKAEFNQHLSLGMNYTSAVGFDHTNVDTDNTIVVPNATDYLSAIILMAHLEFHYWWHWQDAAENELGVNQTFQTFSGTYTLGSASITSCTINGSPIVNAATYTGYYFLPIYSGASTWAFPWNVNPSFATGATRVLGTSSGATVIASANIANRLGSNTFTFQFASSKYHYGLDPGNGSVTTPAQYNQRIAAYDLTLTNVFTLQNAALAFEGLLKSHQLGGLTQTTSPTNFLAYNFTGVQTAGALGPLHYLSTTGLLNWPEASVPDPNNSGLPMNQTNAQAYMAAPPLVGSWLYTFVWRYDYTLVSGTQFEWDSTPALFSQVYGSLPVALPLPSTSSQYPVTLTNLPSLPSGPNNIDAANVKLDVYRTIQNGTTFFLVGTTTPGAASFVDSVPDVTLITNQELYTTGGVVANDAPPISKCTTMVNNTVYYGGVTDISSGQFLPNRVLQSVPFAPYAVNATFYVDLDDFVVGLSNFSGFPLAFCSLSLFRLEGSFNDTGAGAIIGQPVSRNVGAISHNGIVQTEMGVFFCGTGGIYYTDAYQLIKVNMELVNTYNSYTASPTQRQRVVGTYDRLNRRIYWTFMSSPVSQEADTVWVLDLNFGVSEAMPFTTMSGGPLFTPTALAFFQGMLVRGDSNGYMTQYQASYKSDPKINVNALPSTWTQQALIYDFESVATNFGSPLRKWATRVTLESKLSSRVSVAINHKDDNGRGGWRTLIPIRNRNLPWWGDPSIKWNDTVGYNWSYDGMIDEFRRFTAGSLRCDWKAVQFTNANVIICGSDVYGLSNTGATAGGFNTITLQSAAYKWPLLCAGNYTISFQADGYVQQFPIAARLSDSQIQITDLMSQSPQSITGEKWQINGIPLNERFQLTSYNITYSILGDEQKPYQGATSTDGGANV